MFDFGWILCVDLLCFVCLLFDFRFVVSVCYWLCCFVLGVRLWWVVCFVVLWLVLDLCFGLLFAVVVCYLC